MPRSRSWQLCGPPVGVAMSRRLGPTPAPLTRVFPWLHVRLDDKPRCYGYAAFQSTA